MLLDVYVMGLPIRDREKKDLVQAKRPNYLFLKQHLSMNYIFNGCHSQSEISATDE